MLNRTNAEPNCAIIRSAGLRSPLQLHSISTARTTVADDDVRTSRSRGSRYFPDREEHKQTYPKPAALSRLLSDPVAIHPASFSNPPSMGRAMAIAENLRFHGTNGSEPTSSNGLITERGRYRKVLEATVGPAGSFVVSSHLSQKRYYSP